MDTIIRGMRNVLRNPLRLIMVVLLLGASLMLVAAMVSLNGSAQQQLANVHKEVGTAITINYVTNNSQDVGPNTGGQGQAGDNAGPNGGGGRGFFNQATSTPIPNTTITTVKKLPGIATVEESLRRTDTNSTLKTSTFQTPSGRSISLPPTINGISTDATHFTLAGGSTPTLQSGRTFQASDANSSVAMMSQTLATTNNLTLGSTFSLKGKTFTVIGLYTTDQTFANNSLVMPLTVMQNIYSVNGVDSITAYAQSYEQVNTVANKLRTTLGKSYDVVTEASTYANTINALNTAQNSIQLALIVSIITATLVIIFAVFITVHERTSEIGALKAIGASHWQVIRQFWGEVLALSAAAAIIAVVLLATLGPVISQAFNVSTPAATTTAQTGFRGGPFGPGRNLFASQATQLSNVHLSSATLNVQTLLIIVGLGMGLAVMTSVIPAWYVARIKPAEVLRRG
ncbi:ABC transporter permease [Dictyobacter kobayashii]|uniref:ABC transporter permease n=1 Tax=Dictyobacter kobayashii TaxID=2014872 RepID=A0A402AT35_9CHLR|nr:ABC transporter permease [Dictyobacter kobayashii]GCE22278.1 ABC transporter permease [Dictyobacter kobayashii]